jgi:type IV pilus assembly protein PilB
LPAVVEEWKRLASCDVHEQARPQDGRIAVTFAGAAGDGGDLRLDMRVCFLPAALGEALTARILDVSAAMLRLDRLEYSDHDRDRILRAIHQPWGIVVCAGPTGSGKTTTLYACLAEVADPGVKVMSVEDPVEYHLPWVTQVAVKQREGLGFSALLRSFLRSDPDVVLVGEVRNLDTMHVCVQAALTGHLVMTSLHTDDAAGALKRMKDIGLDPFLIGDATKLVVAQRLVRKLCQHCSADYTPSADELRDAETTARMGGLTWTTERRFKRPVGCEKCARTGFRGRSVISETLEMTPEIAESLRREVTVPELRALAVGQGMVAMAGDGVRRAAAGETTLGEVTRVCKVR